MASRKPGEVARLTNRIRARHGLRPLRWRGGLARAARKHARDMARRNYLSHDTRGGASWVKRILRWYREPAGENIGRGFSTAEGIVEGWMNSPLHRRNILNSEFRTIGVGYSSDGDYWVQDFGY